VQELNHSVCTQRHTLHRNKRRTGNGTFTSLVLTDATVLAHAEQPLQNVNTELLLLLLLLLSRSHEVTHARQLHTCNLRHSLANAYRGVKATRQRLKMCAEHEPHVLLPFLLLLPLLPILCYTE
jgi:hypothetical protein